MMLKSTVLMARFTAHSRTYAQARKQDIWLLSSRLSIANGSRIDPDSLGEQIRLQAREREFCSPVFPQVCCQNCTSLDGSAEWPKRTLLTILS